MVFFGFCFSFSFGFVWWVGFFFVCLLRTTSEGTSPLSFLLHLKKRNFSFLFLWPCLFSIDRACQSSLLVSAAAWFFLSRESRFLF